MEPGGKGGRAGAWRSIATLACLWMLTTCTRDPGGIPDEVERRLRVPRADGDPVLLDGRFEDHEWDDAAAIEADSSITLHFKAYRGHVFIGARVRHLRVPVIDLFVADVSGRVTQFHASAQLGERQLHPGEDEPPAFRWGSTRGWYANEVRYDPVIRDSLEAAGVDPGEAILASVYPYDGFEMQLLASKLPGPDWRIRVEVHSGVDDVSRIYPSGTTRDDPAGWLSLEFR